MILKFNWFALFRHIYGLSTVDYDASLPVLVEYCFWLESTAGLTYRNVLCDVISFDYAWTDESPWWGRNVLCRPLLSKGDLTLSKTLLANMYWKLLLILVTEYINSDVVLFFDFIDLFDSHRKLDTVIVQLFCYYFVRLFDCWAFLAWGVMRRTWHHLKPSLSEFLILINPFNKFWQYFGVWWSFRAGIVDDIQVVLVNGLDHPSAALWEPLANQI